jgi:hypothetical protein
VHDFDPGIHPYPGGLFWTVPLQSDREDEGRGSVRVDLDDSKARMTANLQVRDFFNIPNALFRFQKPASVRATVSFDIRWLGPGNRSYGGHQPAGLLRPAAHEPGDNEMVSGERPGIQL